MPNDPERELRAKLVGLAGNDVDWLLVAAAALEKAQDIIKKMFLEAADDDKARKLVEGLIKQAGAVGGGQGAGAKAEGRARVQPSREGRGQVEGRASAQQGEGRASAQQGVGRSYARAGCVGKPSKPFLALLRTGHS